MKPQFANKTFYLVFTLFIVLHLILIWSMQLYPYHDLPWHLAAATILKFYGEPGNLFSEYFTISSGIQPNVFHLVFTSLDIFPSVEIGNKWFLTLYIILLPVSTLLLIKHFNGNPWFSLLSFLYLYNYNVRWGFVGFVIAIPFFLLLLYFILRSANSSRNTIWNRLMVMILFIVLFFTHALPTILALMTFGLILLYRYWKTPLRIFIEGLVIVPVLAIMVLWWTSSQQDSDTVGFLIQYYSSDYFTTIYKRGGLFLVDNYTLFAGAPGYIVAGLLSMALLGFAWIWVKPRLNNTLITDLKNNFSAAAGAWIFLGCSLFVFLFGPDRLPEQWYLYQRFAVFVCLALIIVLSILFSQTYNRAYITAICLAVVIHFALFADYHIDFNKETKAFTKEMLPGYERNNTLAALLAEDVYRGYHLYQHFANYHIVWNQGIATTALMDFRFGTIRRKANLSKLPKYNSWFGREKGYDGSYSGMDYILVRGTLPAKVIYNMPEFIKTKTNGEWSLYKRKQKYVLNNVN